MTGRSDFQAILRTLADHGVEFIVVGGVCAVLHGAPVSTFDLDVVHSRDEENIARLLKALDSLGARYRAQPQKELKPGRARLASPGHQLLMTRFGPLDVLGTIGTGHSYADLLGHAVVMRVGRNLRVQVLDLDALIEVKQETAGQKDQAVLAILRRMLDEKARS